MRAQCAKQMQTGVRRIGESVLSYENKRKRIFMHKFDPNMRATTARIFAISKNPTGAHIICGTRARNFA